MKRKWLLPFAAWALALCLLCGCDLFVKTVTVNINDNGAVVTAEGKETMTVSELLEQAGVTLRAGDRTTPDGNVVWKDANATEITIRRAVNVTVTDGTTARTVTMTDGTVGQAIARAGFDLTQYKTDADLTAEATDGMTVTVYSSADPREGWVEENGVRHYYVDNELQRSTVVGSDEEGYQYVNEEGVIDSGYCDGVTVGETDWIVINGAATAVSDDWGKTLFAACKDIAKCTTSSMTKDEKLKAAFDFIKTNYLEGVRHNPPYREADWPVVCANDLFVYGKGDCYSYGAAFAFLGKAIGCEEVYACNSGGHGWAEIDGKYYDPEWSLHSNKYTYFAVGAHDTDVAYYTVDENSESWKRVRL